ncbi:PTS sugar transporter subunit IIA [Oenococcus sp.]|uniref:PTS sugar transporter subunit IIA n=1 Tax=Oenococcus sp. TaxID=1979414 RepID=UPI0039ED3413
MSINRGILVITHGHFGVEIVKSAEMIMGPQSNVTALALNPGESVEGLRQLGTDSIKKFTDQGKETIVLTDLYGGSPSNTGLYLLSKGAKVVMTGLNLPMLIELLQNYESIEDWDELVDDISKAAVDGVRNMNINFIKK